MTKRDLKKGDYQKHLDDVSLRCLKDMMKNRIIVRSL